MNVLGSAFDDFVGTVLEKKTQGELEQLLIKNEVGELKRRLEESETKWHRLALEKGDLETKLKKFEVDREDIFEYLHGELAKKTDEIVRLEEKAYELEQDKDMSSREYEAKLHAKKEEAEEMETKLREEIKHLTDDLTEIQEFKDQKAQMEADLAETKRTLSEERKEHTNYISSLERKHVQEKDRLKKEMLLKLRETKANLLKMTDNQLDTTTKRTIAENEQMSSELAWQSKETEKLIRKNDKLQADNQGLRRQLSLHQQTQEEFAKKVHVYQKTIKTLLAKLNNLDQTKRAELETLRSEGLEKEQQHAEQRHQVQLLEEQLTSHKEQLGQHQNKLSELSKDHDSVQLQHANSMALQDEAVRFILATLADAKLKLHRSHGDLPPTTTTDIPELLSRDGQSLDLLGSEYSELPVLDELEPEQRQWVLSFLLKRMQEYQGRLRELQLHQQWRMRTTDTSGTGGVQLPPIMPILSSNWGALAKDGPLTEDQPPSVVSVGVQTSSSQKPLQLPDTTPVMGAAQAASEAQLISVDGPVRPWGKRAKELPLTRHTPTTYQRKKVTVAH